MRGRRFWRANPCTWYGLILSKEESMKQKITLYAEEGKILTDGKRFARIAYHVDADEAGTWREIPEEEYNAGTAAEETEVLGGDANA